MRISDWSSDVCSSDLDGQSIIAGRALPDSEWILLNNGSPIASVRADANGEWVVLPDAALVPGANAFSLVAKAERGRVTIPAPGALAPVPVEPRPEGRRVGKECVRPGRSRGSAAHYNKKIQ